VTLEIGRENQRRYLRLLVVALWASGTVICLYDGTDPGFWLWYNPPHSYPWIAVLKMTLKISAESAALCLLLTRLPIRRLGRRICVTLLLFSLLFFSAILGPVTDQPGWVYSNIEFLFLVNIVLLIVGGVLGTAELLKRHRSTFNAA
jgi:hypothetical protein